MASENFDPSDINQPACGNSLLNSRPSVLTNTNFTQVEAKWKVPLLGANLPHLSLSPASWMVLSRRTLAIRSLQTFLLLFSHAYMHLMLPLLWQTIMHSLCQFVHITTTWCKWKCLEEGGEGGIPLSHLNSLLRPPLLTPKLCLLLVLSPCDCGIWWGRKTHKRLWANSDSVCDQPL